MAENNGGKPTMPNMDDPMLALKTLKLIWSQAWRPPREVERAKPLLTALLCLSDEPTKLGRRFKASTTALAKMASATQRTVLTWREELRSAGVVSFTPGRLDHSVPEWEIHYRRCWELTEELRNHFVVGGDDYEMITQLTDETTKSFRSEGGELRNDFAVTTKSFPQSTPTPNKNETISPPGSALVRTGAEGLNKEGEPMQGVATIPVTSADKAFDSIWKVWQDTLPVKMRRLPENAPANARETVAWTLAALRRGVPADVLAEAVRAETVAYDPERDERKSRWVSSFHWFHTAIVNAANAWEREEGRKDGKAEGRKVESDGEILDAMDVLASERVIVVTFDREGRWSWLEKPENLRLLAETKRRRHFAQETAPSVEETLAAFEEAVAWRAGRRDSDPAMRRKGNGNGR